MFHLTTCPTCQTKFTIPEGAMGKRQVCPHCQSPFMAGTSPGPGAPAPGAPAPAGVPGLAKTMLGETEPPIRFNCPRCKKPLEVPAIEALTKRPCPECGQRLQVPAAPAPSAAPQAAGLNKTLLASDESKAEPIRYNCPNCKKPLESPAIEALSKKNCPACGQRFQIPATSTGTAARPNLNKTLLASDESRPGSTGVQSGQPGASSTVASTSPAAAASGQSAGEAIGSKKGMLIGGGVVVLLGLIFLVLIACIASIFIGSGDRAMAKELEALKMKIKEDQDKAERRIEQEKRDHEARMTELRHQQQLAAAIGNAKQRAEAEEKIQRDRDEWERKNKEQQLNHERDLARIRAESEAAAARAAAIRPAYYHPGYWYRGYWYPY